MGATSSKLAFKQSVFRLFEEQSIPPSDAFWAQFWEVPETVEDVFMLFSTADVRRTRDTALTNLEHLVVSDVSRLIFLLRHSQIHYAPVQQTAQQASEALQAARAAGTDGNAEVPLSAERATKETLNCMRILTRVLPFIFEKPELAQWRDELFWRQAIDEDDERPLGATLVDTLTDFLFLPGFSLPLACGMDSTVAYTIWETGIGSTTPVGTNHQFESNKIETLRTILTITSEAMYHPSSLLPTRGVRFISYIVCNPDKRVVLGMLCSLLNSTMKFNPGWRVPYNHVVFADPRQLLVTYMIQLLMVLATYSVPENENLAALGVRVTGEGPLLARNWYRFYLGRLHRIQDLQFLADGMSRLLNQPMQASASYLPGSQRQVEWAPELIMLFWELVRYNARFRNYVISSDRIHDFVVLFLYYAHTYRLDPSRLGIVRLSIYVLQTISCDSVFCVRLNRPFESHHALPSTMRIPGWQSASHGAGAGGTYTDYLLLSIYSLVSSSKGQLAALYPNLLDIHINLAPHIVNLSRLTCARMMHLLGMLSAPSFLLAKANNHLLLEKLLLAINEMVVNNSHQSNTNLLYTLFRAKRKFVALQELTFERCLEDVRSQRRAAGSAGDRKDDVVIVFNAADYGEGSERSKGKAPAATTSSTASNSPRASSSQDEPGEFVPTEYWFESWHSKLELNLIAHLYEALPVLIPKLDHILPLQSAENSASTSPTRHSSPETRNYESEILSALRHVDDDVIASGSYTRQFHEPIAFEWTVAAKGWYYSVLWAEVFVTHEIVAGDLAGTGVWRGTNVALFRVQTTKAAGLTLMRPRGAVDAVAKSVLDRLGATQ
ncbi:high-temperature-induced dauer-formation protein-domain-containing protein [Lipomyces arxii]|uniref:high-temperature-induced dauer-formation protein-domain-containing protein n=1 Tax=Lipomyces arxii TaxID=56418 RepID=UPI0034CE55E0